MSVPLQYDFSVVGLRNVLAAFESVERKAGRTARVVSSQFAAGQQRAARGVAGAGGGPGARGAASPMARAFTDLGKIGEREARREYQQRERLARSFWTGEMRRIDAARSASHRVRAATVFGAVTSAKDAVKGVGTAGAAIAGGGAAALIASRVAPVVDLEQRQRQVIINARGAGAESAFSYEGLRDQIKGVAMETGISLDDATAGVEKFVQRTGDIRTAVANLRVWATTAAATGATTEDLASAAADLADKFGITDPKEMADALATLTFQGKKGAFEIRDIAEQFPEMGAAAQRVGLKGAGGVRTLGAIAQIARRGTGSGAEASTAVQMMFTQLVGSSAAIQSGEAFGGAARADVYEGGDLRGKMRAVPEVLADVIAASGGHTGQLQKIFDVRGMRAASPMLDAFKTRKAEAIKAGYSEGDATKMGRQAVIDLIEDAATASGSFADVQRDAAEMQAATGRQLEVLNTELTSAISRALVPEMKKLVPELTKAAPAMAEIVRVMAQTTAWFAQNPFTGLGALVLGKVAADLAMAGIGAAVSRAIVGMIAGASAGQAAGAVAAGMAGLSGGTAAAGGMLAGARAGLAGAVAGGGALGMLGVGAAAVGAGLLVDDQNDRLKSVSGGMGMLDFMAAMVKGGGVSAGLDEMKRREDQAARDEASKRQVEAADKLAQAAEKLKIVAAGGPNRSNDPAAPRP